MLTIVETNPGRDTALSLKNSSTLRIVEFSVRYWMPDLVIWIEEIPEILIISPPQALIKDIPFISPSSDMLSSMK